jgi:hypothetical protein
MIKVDTHKVDHDKLKLTWKPPKQEFVDNFCITT